MLIQSTVAGSTPCSGAIAQPAAVLIYRTNLLKRDINCESCALVGCIE